MNSWCFVLSMLSFPLMTACGDGGSTVGGNPGGFDGLAARTAAASAAAQEHPACTRIGAFYWEIGDQASLLASGSVGGETYRADTRVAIASASKWLYGSFLVQRQNGILTAEDIRFLTFRSGYTKFGSCIGSFTVGGCLAIRSNGVFDPSTDGFFSYGGGHMQKHAVLKGLGGLTAARLGTEIRSQLGAEIEISYDSPQLAGGAVVSAAEYAKVLRKILANRLAMHDVLGKFPVCVDPATCPEAVSTPSPPGEQWHYSIGHWVEDDPKMGDGAFSSPGAFGFYPWVDASKRWYGIVVQESLAGAYESLNCGRQIRKAWVNAAPA
jgi:hypothetical protein